MNAPYAAQPAVTIEICVEDVAGIAAARAEGADRVEFCSDLSTGGLTPPVADVSEALDVCPAGGLQVLVRSRPGDFVYEDSELALMCEQIVAVRASYDAWVTARAAEDAPRLGFVVGALTPALGVDERATEQFRAAAGPHRLTFHRAFDSISDQPAALEHLIELGYERVLTTGGNGPVADLPGLSALIRQGGDRIEILVSGGLRSGNVAAAVAHSGAREIHMRAPYAEGPGTDRAEIARIVAAVRALPASS